MRDQHQTFFKFIYSAFGLYYLNVLKEWIRHRRLFYKNKNRVRFLKNCNNMNIIPPHLFRLKCKISFNFDKCSAYKMNLATDNYIRKVIKLEMNDAYLSIDNSRKRTFHLARIASKGIPLIVLNKFFQSQDHKIYRNFLKDRQRIDRKLTWLRLRDKKRIVDNVKEIKYYWLKPTSSDKKFDSDDKIILNKMVHPPEGHELIDICISPKKYTNSYCSLMSVRDRWFINLSTTVIPKSIRCLLQLGANFSLPTTNKNWLTMEFIKNVENNIMKIQSSLQNTVRNQSVTIINRIWSFKQKKKYLVNKLMKSVPLALRFFKQNSNIIFTCADKGNLTVVLDRIMYINKVNSMLDDDETYNKILKDPTSKINNKLRCLLAGWKRQKYILDSTYRKLYCSDGNIPRAYALPKVHKPDCPFRIIISSTDSTLYNLARYCHELIVESIPKTHSHIENSFELVRKLKNTKVDPGQSLISLDVVSLFTNIPLDLAMEALSQRWSLISLNCKFPKTEFLKAIQLILDSTYFSFDNQFYKQTFGTPMGSPLSPILADLVMVDLENWVLNNLNHSVTFYYRYVDDIILCLPQFEVNSILDKFNAYHPRLQFTLEVGGNAINFLDTTVIIRDESIIFDWYQKPTNSGRLLNFVSQHPIAQKRGVVYSLVDRVFYLSHPEFHKKNLELVVEILLDNDYPIPFIFSNINGRIKTLVHKSGLSKVADSDISSTNTTKWFSIPYVEGISERFKSFIKGGLHKVAYFSLNKLYKFIKVHKDPLPNEEKRNVIYKINCRDCDASYVGQTGRRLKTRMAEHYKHINGKSTTNSVITNHRLNLGHEFEWNNVKILDEERCYNKRLLSEMIHINRQTSGLNRQYDTVNLNKAYSDILNKL